MKIKKIIYKSNMNDLKPKTEENDIKITLMAASNDIYIVDPKGEYSSLIKLLGGAETEIDIDK